MSPSLLIFIISLIALLQRGVVPYVIDYQMTSNYDSIVWKIPGFVSTVHML